MSPTDSNDHASTLPERRPVSGFAFFGFAFSILAAAIAVLGGLGVRWDFWSYETGVEVVQWAVYGATGAIVLSLVGIVIARPGGRRSGTPLAALGLVIGLFTVGVPWSVRESARSAPAINDVSTDAADPPKFRATADEREAVDEPGAERMPSDEEAYPELGPLITDRSPGEVFPHALETAEAQGWEIVSADPKQARIEAVATTFWFGLEEDVVVRITPHEGGSRVDVRSASRERPVDGGSNADRIRGYLEALQARL